MNNSRRNFVKKTLLTSTGLGLLGCTESSFGKENEALPQLPVVISTWDHGELANEVAAALLEKGKSALDAVEQGVKIIEADPKGSSVGIGGSPDRDGNVTLDACIMDNTGNCGAVCFLQNIKHPISVARKVMENTPHVMLAGEGAFEFALEQGFKKENLLTPDSIERWEKWKKKAKYEPKVNQENHDTISQLALDKSGNLSGACTTSGLAYKMKGRVGDSPIIGAALYVDNEVGAACATGMGELVMKTLGSFLIVELMRNGKSPQKACEEAVMRIVNKIPYEDLQVGYLAIDNKGNYGAYSIQAGFTFALYQNGENKMHKAASFLERKEEVDKK